MEKKEAGKLNIDQTLYTTRLSRRYAGRKAYTPPRPGRIYSFIPGTVIEVLVRQGDLVNAGDDIVILDAMKMKNRLKSHVTGKVAAVNVKPGDRVSKGMVLVEID
ncbi:MAG: acetyl-CoA carboxylase biotin carboxyl carrier protein subunit [Bacteroidales bacterium]|jgi:biotin carboxyl carrier protein